MYKVALAAINYLFDCDIVLDVMHCEPTKEKKYTIS